MLTDEIAWKIIKVPETTPGLREGNHLGDPGVDGRIILRWIFKKWNGGEVMDWVELTQDRDSWRDLVDAVMNLWFP
jgi:hypothetical protein